jgi:hypothetical protein
MPDHFIELEWWRDQSSGAFEIVDAHPPKNLKPPARTRPDGSERRIHWKGRGKLSAYRPLDDYGHELIKRLVAVNDEESPLRFVSSFGLLDGPNGPKPYSPGDTPEEVYRKGVSVRSVIDHADDARAYLDIALGGQREALDWVKENDGAVPVWLEVDIAADKAGKALRMRYRVRTLKDAIMLEQSLMLTAGASWRICRMCSRPFPAGPGQDRNLNSLFCSEEHKTEFHSKDRSKRK